jgi:TPR repeat protein
MQLTKAYSCFITDDKNTTFTQMRKILVDASGEKFNFHALVIGGKTGTARIVDKYPILSKKNYNASFIGYVYDSENHMYTIGVLVSKPQEEKVLSDQTAIPVFKKIIEALGEEKYLRLNPKKATDKVHQGVVAYNSGNYSKAIELFSQACKNGYANACYNLAIIYENSKDVKANESKIKKFFKRSCDLGFDLGCMNYEAIK